MVRVYKVHLHVYIQSVGFYTVSLLILLQFHLPPSLDYYPNCDIFYKGLPNIHTVRKSFHQMRAVLNSEDQTKSVHAHTVDSG